jgi:hypothetical protein
MRRTSGRSHRRDGAKFSGLFPVVMNWADVPGQNFDGQTRKVGVFADHPEGIDRIEFYVDGALAAVVRQETLNTETAGFVPSTTIVYPGTTGYWFDCVPSTTTGVEQLVEAFGYAKKGRGRTTALCGIPDGYPKGQTGVADPQRGWTFTSKITRPVDVHVNSQSDLDAWRPNAQNGQRVYFDSPGLYDICFVNRLGVPTLNNNVYVEFIATVGEVEIGSRSRTNLLDLGNRVLRLTAGSTSATQLSTFLNGAFVHGQDITRTAAFWGRTNFAPIEGIGQAFLDDPTSESTLNPHGVWFTKGTLVRSTYPATTAVTLTQAALQTTPADRTGTITSGGNTITGISTTGLSVGLMVIGTGISSVTRQNGLSITAIDTVANTVTLSGTATTGGTYTFSFGVLSFFRGGQMDAGIFALKTQGIRWRTDTYDTYTAIGGQAYLWFDKCSFEEFSDLVPEIWNGVEIPKVVQTQRISNVYFTNHYANFAGFGVNSALLARNLFQGNVYDFHQGCRVVKDSIIFGQNTAGGPLVQSLHHADVAQIFNGVSGIFFDNVVSWEPLEDTQFIFVCQDVSVPGEGMNSGCFRNMRIMTASPLGQPAFSQLQGPLRGVMLKNCYLGSATRFTDTPFIYSASRGATVLRTTAGSKTAAQIGLTGVIFGQTPFGNQYASSGVASRAASGMNPQPNFLDWDTFVITAPNATTLTLDRPATATTPAARTGDVTANSAIVTNIDTTGLTAGLMLLGTGVSRTDATTIAGITYAATPLGIPIKSIDSPTQLTLTFPATITGAGVTLNFGLYVNLLGDVRGRMARYNRFYIENYISADNVVASVGGITKAYANKTYGWMGKQNALVTDVPIPAGAAAPVCFNKPTIAIKGGRAIAVGEYLKVFLRLNTDWDQTIGKAPAVTAYKWYRDGVAIPGALAAVYQLVASDTGHTFECDVIAYNGYGQITTVRSQPYAVSF